MLRALAQAALAAIFVIATAVGTAEADTITVMWDPNPPQDLVVGYWVYVGTAANAYTEVFDAGNQDFFIYPSAVAGQQYFFAVVAYNAVGTSLYSTQVSGYSNAPPSLQNPGTQSHAISQPVSLQLVGSDLYGQPLTYGAAGLPPGLTFNPGTGLIAGAATTNGIYSVTVTASDGVLIASQLFTWVIGDTASPTLTITSPTTAATYSTAGDTVALGGTANDDMGLAAVTWVNNRGGSGTAAGTTTWSIAAVPLQLGPNVITVTAHDASGLTATAVLTVTGTESVAPTVSITIPTSSSTYLTASDTMSLGGLANDNIGITAVTWANNRGGSGTSFVNIVGGAAFWGAVTLLTLQPGVNVITATAWDNAGNSANAILTVTLNRAPVVTNPGPQTAFQGVGAALFMTATDADVDLLTWSASNLPPGLAIDASTGVISGTPTAIGTFAVVITASDGTANDQQTFTLTVTSPLPVAANPIAPTGTTTSTTPTFTWAAVSNAGYYLLWVDEVATGVVERWYTPAQAGCHGSSTCSGSLPNPLAAGLARWSVLTWNPYGYGPWSATVSVVVDVQDAATATPSTGGPSGPIGTRTPSYGWNPVSQAIWYQLTVTDAQATVREFWYTSAEACVTTPCGVTPNVLLAIGPAQWQLRAWRASGAGAWTTAVSFETADAAPGKATLVTPAAPVPTDTPPFTWSAVLGTSYYLLRIIDRDNVLIERWYRPSNAGCPSGTGTCTVSLGVSIKAGLATWQVLTWNGSGYGPWSDPRDFTVDLSDPSAAVPDPVSPTGTIAASNVAYTWTSVAGAVSYRLSIRNNGGPALQWWFTPAGAGCASGTQCTVFPQAGLVAGTAEWQVQAWTTIGHGNWSPPVGLTVSIATPTAPDLVSPSGATSSTPAFVWNASAVATYYYVEVIDSGGLRVDRWLTPAAVGCSAGTGTCTHSPGVTLNPGAGSWRVIAWNPSGYSPWSSTNGFVVP